MRVCACPEEKGAGTEGQGGGDQTVVMATDGSCCMVEGGSKNLGGVGEGMMFTHMMTVHFNLLSSFLVKQTDAH